MVSIVLGVLLISLPFIGFTIFMYVKDGWRAVFFVYGFVIVMVIPTVVGAWLLSQSF